MSGPVPAATPAIGAAIGSVGAVAATMPLETRGPVGDRTAASSRVVGMVRAGIESVSMAAGTTEGFARDAASATTRVTAARAMDEGTSATSGVTTVAAALAEVATAVAAPAGVAMTTGATTTDARVASRIAHRVGAGDTTAAPATSGDVASTGIVRVSSPSAATEGRVASRIVTGRAGSRATGRVSSPSTRIGDPVGLRIVTGRADSTATPRAARGERTRAVGGAMTPASAATSVVRAISTGMPAARMSSVPGRSAPVMGSATAV